MSEDITRSGGYVLKFYADPGGPVGHFSVRIQGPDGAVHDIVGKYPADADKPTSLSGDVPGAIRDDSDRASNDDVIRREIPLPDKEAADAAADYLRGQMDKAGAYNLFDDSCVDLLQGTLDAAGVDGHVADYFDDKDLDRMGDLPLGAGDAAQADRDKSDQQRRRDAFHERRRREKEEEKRRKTTPEPGKSGQEPQARQEPEASGAKGRGAAASDADRARLKTAVVDALNAIDPEEAVLLKPPADWSEPEAKSLMRRDGYWGGDPGRRKILQDGVAGWFGAHAGNEPVARDGTGKAVERPWKRDPAKEPKPLMTADGLPLSAAFEGIGDRLTKRNRSKSAADAVRGFQAGLNRLADAQETAEPEGEVDPYRRFDRPAAKRPKRLKEDGLFGPKTAEATRFALVNDGAERVLRASEAFRA
ncbi:MAG: hypothetical protein RIB45_00755 [Marivibrio sp.]|uniref:hypothetical protein n=1 Tax=Marivibrio sp. TaxID=2039719 RepID=UPI0032EC6E1D